MNRINTVNGDPDFECGPSDLSDELLVSAAQAGDASAFVELKDRHANKLLSRIYRITRNWQDAEDVLQESFLKAFVHLPGFEGRSSFSSWITRIAINSALMLLRKRRVVEVSIDAFASDGGTWSGWEIADIRTTSEEAYAQREVEQHLRSAIRRLRPALRKVVHLRRSEDYPTSEIAAALGISVAAAKSRLMRAKTALRASMP
jgi:RNA polymerase sigma factor (sigma-70 family)